MNNCAGAIYLTIILRNPDNAAHDPTQSVTGAEQDKQPKPLEDTIRNPTATDKSGSNWKSTAYATTKLVINLLKESADAFPPLKSAVGGVSAILDHCDVRFIFHTTPSTMLTAVTANNRLSQNNKSVDAPGRRAGRIAVHACSRGRSQGRTEKGSPQTVGSRSPGSRVQLTQIIC